MTTEQSSEPAASTTAGLTTSPAPASGGSEVVGDSDFARDAGVSTLGESFRDYVRRVRGGEVGALPAILGLVILGVIFATLSDRFLTVANLANLVSQSGITVFIAMGLVFILLLGEIDLALGTASGACAALMGLSLTKQGNLQTALGTTTFLVVIAFMLLALAGAYYSRLWYVVGIVGVGIVMVAFHLGTSTQLGAMFVAVSAGVAIGTLTGFLVAKVGIPSFVVTLALFLGWQGVLLQFIGTGAAISVSNFPIVDAISNGNLPPVWGWIIYLVLVGGYVGYTLLRSVRRRAEGLSAEPIALVLTRGGALAVIGGVAVFLLNKERGVNPNFSIAGAPYVLPLIIVFMVAWSLILTKTRFGRYVYAVGGNAEAARRAGIDLSRIRIAAFAIGSGMAAVGGIAQASKIGSVPSDAGGGNTLLFAVAAAVIGGTSLFGGRGRARDAVIGGLVIAMIPNGLGLIPNLPASANFIITAVVLLVAASADAVSRRRSRAAGR